MEWLDKDKRHIKSAENLAQANGKSTTAAKSQPAKITMQIGDDKLYVSYSGHFGGFPARFSSVTRLGN